MREIIEGWQGTDAALLDELNARTIKQLTPNPTSEPGFFGFRGMGLINTPVAVQLGHVLKSLADNMAQAVNDDGTPDQATRALGTTVLGFWHIFYHDVQGLALANDNFRAQLTALLQSAGQSQEFIDAVLAFGYTMVSPAFQALGRDATQADIDATRETMAREAALAAIQQRANAADEAARAAFIAGNSAAEITALGVAAWEAQ